MNILQIANGYFLSNLYNLFFSEIKKTGVICRVFVPLAKKNTVSAPDGIEYVNCFSQFDRFLFYSKQHKIIKAIRRLYPDMESFDVIHAHTLFSAGYSAMQLKRRYGIPYVVAVRNTDKNTFFRYMIHLRSLGVRIMREADTVIFLSEAYRSSIIKTYVPKRYQAEIVAKSRVIPNGISSIFLSDKGTPRTLPSEKKLRLIYVGEISTNKNVETTVAAAKQLISEGWDISFTVVGEVKENKYWDILNNTEFITYHEKTTQDIIKQYFRQADIFVMPSHTETFGLVYAEAMSQGLPVVFTRGQGFDGHFPDGTVGYAVDDRNPADIAEKVKWIAEDYTAMAENCIQLADRFDWQEIAKQYKELYQKIREDRI